MVFCGIKERNYVGMCFYGKIFKVEAVTLLCHRPQHAQSQIIFILHHTLSYFIAKVLLNIPHDIESLAPEHCNGAVAVLNYRVKRGLNA